MEHHFEVSDPLVAFDRALGDVNGRYVPTTVLHSRSGDKQWFDASCRRVFAAVSTPGVEHAMRNIWVNLCLLMRRHK